MITVVAKLWARAFSLPPPFNPTRYLHNRVVDHLYDEFKHVMVVNPEIDYDLWADDRTLDHWCRENGCYYMGDRVLYDIWAKRWLSNGIGGGDYFFIATNDTESFVYAQMVWG